jgi:exopolysaccharide biosynthesis polyprenyl glycosylphosphotransferase
MIYFTVATILTIIERIIMRVGFYKLGDMGLNTKRIIIVGNSERGIQFIEYMKNHEYLNMKVIGYIHIDEPKVYEGVPHIGELEDLLEIAQEYVIDEIVVARTINDDERLNNILNKCQLMGITITMLLDLKNRDNTKAQVAMYGTLPTLKFHTVSLDESQLLAKRMLDVLGSAVGLILFGIAFIIVGPFIKLETPGPIIFKQNRVGRNGRIFKIWKFRSMGVNAEEQKCVLLGSNEMDGHMFKIENDPRITRVGAFIRRTSIDELPQFVNVFKGDMSLVGTRPPTVDEVKSYGFHHYKRISITPGITGKWQVSGRSDIKDFEEVVRLDTEYIEKWTIWEDIKIILKTILVVVTKKGSR